MIGKYHIRHVTWNPRGWWQWGQSFIIETGEASARRLAENLPRYPDSRGVQVWRFPPMGNQVFVCEVPA